MYNSNLNWPYIHSTMISTHSQKYTLSQIIWVLCYSSYWLKQNLFLIISSIYLNS